MQGSDGLHMALAADLVVLLLDEGRGQRPQVLHVKAFMQFGPHVAQSLTVASHIRWGNSGCC